MGRSKTVLFTLSAILLFECKDNCPKSDRCALALDVGPCKAQVTKYYFDPVDKKCKQFSWGGCGGTVPFETLQECEGGCNCN